MIKKRLQKRLPTLILMVVIASLLLVLAIRSYYNDAINLRNERVESLSKELEAERVNSIIDRGKLDVICENHPPVCQGVE